VFLHLNELYGKLPVSQFTPMMLKTIRCELLERKLCVVSSSPIINIVRQLFYWGCEDEIVPADVALRMSDPYKKGKPLPQPTNA
jgi:hypothetical protein